MSLVRFEASGETLLEVYRGEGDDAQHVMLANRDTGEVSIDTTLGLPTEFVQALIHIGFIWTVGVTRRYYESGGDALDT